MTLACRSAALPLRAPSRPLATLARRDDRAGRSVLRQIQTQVQPHLALRPAQWGEDLGQQRRVQHGLGFGETAQAHGAGADVPLHPLPLAGRAEPAQRAHHRIKQARQEEAQVIGAVHKPPGAGPTRMERHGLDRAGQARLEILDQPPAGEVALGQLNLRRRFSGHAASRPETGPRFQ
jgi:hypothetical protein